MCNCWKHHSYRFASSELDIMETLFIGYLSSAQQLSGRIDALNKTLVSPSSGFTASIKFFIEESTSSHNKLNNHLSLVKLNPLQPNTLPLLTIKYMTTLRSKYKYFMLVPDTVYVIPSTLSDILQGRENRPYLGFISSTSSQCDLSSGIILSRNLIKGDYSLIPNISAISDIDNANAAYQIRRYLVEKELRSVDNDINVIRSSSNMLPGFVSWPPAVRAPFHTSNRFDVIRWTLVSDNTSYLEYDMVNSQPLQGNKCIL
ncbi:hypothetical protein EB796_005939 [Bugula neritina]|uniref:Uncharacterized protein n=1 Tax=Bugula neritina TaxID=10212 RepID=A0A7J7KBU6_BUGNE|nr:hypothetical protein EB796_005939 [Bugula neritina]